MKETYQFTEKQIKLINSKISEFYNLVLEHSNWVFDDFKTNEFLNMYENYKYRTIKNTRGIIKEIKELSDFGKGTIRDKLFEAIEEGYNLVNSFWRNNVQGALLNLKGTKLKVFEENLHDLYVGSMTEEDFFNYYTENVCKIYNIIAYILFLKNCNKYVPIATTTFDSFFESVDLSFRTTSQCSWENYCEYINILEEIRVMLEKQYGFSASLIDSHSFVWTCASSSWNSWRKTYKKECRVEKKYTEAVIKARTGQGKFREKVIQKWQGKCSISNFSKTECMIAAHIKPWKDCNEKECIDSDNGLLLPPNIDFLFDEGNGYITFSDNGTIIFSSKLTADIKKEFNISESIKLRDVNDKTKEYLAWHREHVFVR